MEEGDLVSNLASDEIGFLGSNSYTGKDRIELKEGYVLNQLPRGIVWSAVPLPRFTLFFNCSWAVAGQRPQ